MRLGWRLSIMIERVTILGWLAGSSFGTATVRSRMTFDRPRN